MSIYEFIKNKYNAVAYPFIDERQFDGVVNEIRAESAERIKELEAENERLNTELWKMAANKSGYEIFIRRENAKLKCLVLHLFFTVAHEEWSVWTNILYDSESTSKDKERARRNRSRWGRILNKTFPAYRKAKAELKENK